MAALRSAKKELRTLMRKKLAEVSEGSIAEQSAVAAATLRSMPRYKAAAKIGVYLSMPKGEVITTDIVKDALAEDKQIFVPYIYESPRDVGNNKPRKLMEMVSLHSTEDFIDVETHRDAWGIPSVRSESVAERRRVLGEETNSVGHAMKRLVEPGMAVEGTDATTSDLDMVVMPGMAFDRNCGRLGHGKGFYDFFLKRYHDGKVRSADVHNPPPPGRKMPFLVGLALNEQIMPVGQEVPTGPSDWHLDAVVADDGSVIQCPSFDENSRP